MAVRLDTNMTELMYFIFKLDGSNREKSVKMRRKQQAYTHIGTESFIFDKILFGHKTQTFTFCCTTREISPDGKFC